MRRYSVSPGVEGEFEPGSRGCVLKNLLGVKSKTQMDIAENEAMIDVQKRYYEQSLVTTETTFTAALICQMHKDWLGSIYSWAGKYRTVDVSKGDWIWPRAFLIAQNMANFEKGALAVYTPCRPGKLADICRAIAVVHAELLLIHPFREGNGRLARWLADLMAVQANLPPPLYRFYGKGSRKVREQYLNAVKAGYLKDYDGLVRFFEDAILLRLD